MAKGKCMSCLRDRQRQIQRQRHRQTRVLQVEGSDDWLIPEIMANTLPFGRVDIEPCRIRRVRQRDSEADRDRQRQRDTQ